MAEAILFTWELGAGLGHTLLHRPVIDRLLAVGHRVAFAGRYLTRLQAVYRDRDVSLLQAPVTHNQTPQPITLPITYPQIIHNAGFFSAVEITARTRAWRDLIRLVAPNVIIADHSPSPLLAALALDIPAIVIGTGFCCPPAISPMPALVAKHPHSPQAMLDTQEQLRDNCNAALHALGGEPLKQFSHLFAGATATVLTTYSELDHYRHRPTADYWGISPATGELKSNWPKAKGAKVFAYINASANLPALLKLLNYQRLPIIL